MSDFLCGWIGGAAGVLASHPLDTVRVRVQTSSAADNARLFSVLSSCVQREGVVGLYKGIASPLVWIGVWKAVIFTTYEASLRKLAIHGETTASLQTHVVAAALGGLVGGVVATPMEMIKVNAQSDRRAPAGLTQEISLLRNFLGSNQLMRGMSMHCLAGLSSMPVWFVTNEFLIRQRAAAGQTSRHNLPFGELLVIGGISGTISWVPAYPFDKLKTLWQTHQGTSLVQMIHLKIQAEGVWFLYRGITPTLARAFPQCSATMACYQFASQYLK